MNNVIDIDKYRFKHDDDYFEFESEEITQEKLDKQDKMIRFLHRDPDTIWEAISSEGIKYPDRIEHIMHAKDRSNAKRKFDNDIAKSIGLAIEAENYCMLGMIIADYASKHIAEIAENEL